MTEQMIRVAAAEAVDRTATLLPDLPFFARLAANIAAREALREAFGVRGQEDERFVSE